MAVHLNKYPKDISYPVEPNPNPVPVSQYLYVPSDLLAVSWINLRVTCIFSSLKCMITAFFTPSSPRDRNTFLPSIFRTRVGSNISYAVLCLKNKLLMPERMNSQVIDNH